MSEEQGYSRNVLFGRYLPVLSNRLRLCRRGLLAGSGDVDLGAQRFDIKPKTGCRPHVLHRPAASLYQSFSKGGCSHYGKAGDNAKNRFKFGGKIRSQCENLQKLVRIPPTREDRSASTKDTKELLGHDRPTSARSEQPASQLGRSPGTGLLHPAARRPECRVI